MAAELREETAERAPGRWSRARDSDLLLALVTIVCLVPFADRALHVDDPLFVWAGDHIRREPLDPFGFPVNWARQASAPMYEVTQNPPCILEKACTWLGEVDGPCCLNTLTNYVNEVAETDIDFPRVVARKAA